MQKTHIQERRALWFSYLDWALLDMENAERFRASVEKVLDSCAGLGLDTLILHVRPFADALYQSDFYPWSHLLTGVQGEDPGFDPLECFLEQAHRRKLRVEAWVNPYRIRLNSQLPAGELAPEHPAVLHPEWTRKVGEGLWFDPALPQVRQLVTEGVRELVKRYPVDGIQFDDYFYPTVSPDFDLESYARYGAGQELAAWRRENVSRLVRQVYEAVKDTNPAVEFGISPQADIEINLNQQYSDVLLWMSSPGYVDYILPQTYWGFGFLHPGQGDRFGFRNIVREWMDYPRESGVRLYFGLGAYHIGEGDGCPATAQEWCCGHNLGDMVQYLREQGIPGWAIFRCDSLFGQGEYGALRRQERETLAHALRQTKDGRPW